MSTKFKKIWLFSLLLLLIIGAAAMGGAVWFNQPISSQSVPQEVEIKSGKTTHQIADQLQSKGLIRSALFFRVLTKLYRGSLQAGLYVFSPSQTSQKIYTKLTGGDISEVTVTLIEGWRHEQIAAQLAKQSVISEAKFNQLAGAWEGKLFPDTYRLPLNVSASSIIEILTKNYQRRLDDANLKVSPQQLIIASIVEREAVHDSDRPLIASVFYNRLKLGIKLESDVTVAYARDSLTPPQQYWAAAGPADITISSDYNTYQIAGLPPTPICNPGLKSITAAVNPVTTDYLYFLTSKDGAAHFAKTQAEHERNIAQYL